MFKRTCLSIFFASVFSSASFAENPDWNQIIALIKNLTAAINAADATANDYLIYIKAHLPELEDAIRNNWPAIKGFLASFSQLPNAITYAADAGDNIMTLALVGVVFFSLCLVVSTVVCVSPKIYGFCRKPPPSYDDRLILNDD